MNFQAKPIYFVGLGPVSKSLFLRALLVQSYFPHFQIKNRLNQTGTKLPPKGEKQHKGQAKFAPRALPLGQAEDIHYMKQALKKWQNRQQNNTPLILDCGLSGAVLRFLALRVTRTAFHGASLVNNALPKSVILRGQTPLFKRPIKEVLSILGQLSCEGQLGISNLNQQDLNQQDLNQQDLKKELSNQNSLFIKSRGGWQLKGDAILVPHHRSSQFASAILLNSWLLPFDLYLSLEGTPVSFSYLQMTLSFLSSLGMQINTLNKGKEYHIPKGQTLKKKVYELEPDMGCLFALSAMTVCGGEVVFTNWPEQSLQPDFVFPKLLAKMGFNITHSHHCLKISKGEGIHPITHNIRDCPDLFPMLSTLCVFSERESHLYGAPHLKYKESNRLKKTTELLTKVGKTVCVKEDGLIISGPVPNKKIKPFEFDPAEDHRMAMSAGVLKKAGFPIRILNPKVVNKSFPHFWSIVNLDLI